MKIYYFSDFQNEYSEEILFRMIQKLLKKEYNDHPVALKRYLIVELVKHINTERLLDATVDLLEDLLFITHRLEFEQQIESAIKFENYSTLDVIKIKAISYSEAMYYTLREKELGKQVDMPSLNLQFKKDFIESNNDEICDWIKRKVYMEVTNYVERLPFSEQENQYKSIISSMAKIDYENNTDYFKPEREYFNDLKENLVSAYQSIKSLPSGITHPDFFKIKKAFEIFMDYNNKHIIDAYPDYSFIFQQLLNDKLLRKVEHRVFMDWLKEEDLISDKIHAILIDKGFFRSLTKSTTASRLNNYYIIKDSYMINS